MAEPKSKDKNEAELQALREALRLRLYQLAISLRRIMALEGLTRVLGLAIVLAAFSLAADWLLDLSQFARETFSFISVTTLLLMGWFLIWRIWKLEITPLDMAQALDRSTKATAANAITPRVAAVLESSPHQNDRVVSKAMSDEAVRRDAAWLEQQNLAARFIRWRPIAMTIMCVFLLTIPLIFFKKYPKVANLWADRYFMGSNEPWPRETMFEVVGLNENGALVVPRGELVTMRVKVIDKGQETDRVFLRMRHANGKNEEVSLTRFAEGDFRYDLPPFQQLARATIQGGDGKFGPFVILPVDRPKVEKLSLVYRHARDVTPITHRFDQAEGNLRLLPDTEARLVWQANVPVESVKLISEAPLPGEVRRTGPQTFEMSWTHDQAVQVRIEMVAEKAGLVSHPVPVAVGLREDRPPSVRLVHSGVRTRVTPVATIPLKMTARDDFGILEMDLKTTMSGGPNSAAAALNLSGTNSVALYGPLEKAQRANVEEDLELDLTTLKAAVGDRVQLNAEVVDDCYAGKQTGQSRLLSFQVITADELFREILLRQQQLRARLRVVADQAESLRDDLAVSVLPDDGPGLLRNHRLVQRETWQIHRGLEETVVEMRLNQLGGDESLALIDRQVLTPLQRLHDQLLARQRQALESQASNLPEDAADISSRQVQIVSEFDRVLKNMAQWDSFIDVVNQLNTVIKIEQDVIKETEALKEKQIEKVFENDIFQ